MRRTPPPPTPPAASIGPVLQPTPRLASRVRAVALTALVAGCSSTPLPPMAPPAPYPPVPPRAEPQPAAPPPVAVPGESAPAASSPSAAVPSPVTPPQALEPEPNSGLSAPLEAQRVRLVDALRGTPVTIDVTGLRELRVGVPTRYCFDAGQSAVKPALAAVLDQLAIGYKPQAGASELHVGVPADGGPLMQDRAASVRDYLVSRGVPIARIPVLGQASGSGVELVVSDLPLDR